MKNAILFSVLETESSFTFEPLKIFSGIYIIDAKRFHTTKKILKNVCIVIMPSKLPKLGRNLKGGSGIEIYTDLLTDFLFIKTSKSYLLDSVYEIKFDLKKREIDFENEETDIFEKYGYAICSIHNFIEGSDRHNYFTSESFKKIKSSRNQFINYRHLVNARLSHNRQPPLYTAMNIFDSAFKYDSWDDIKFILSISMLEALFSTSSSELSFRLSSNIARFLYPLERDFKKRLEKVQMIKKLYSYRSRIVHGGGVEIPIEKYDEIQRLLCEILEKIIEVYKNQNFFLDNRKHKEFIKNLEVGHFFKK